MLGIAARESAFREDLKEDINYNVAEANYGKGSRQENPLDNHQVGDGHLYRGRGFIQLTGRFRYEDYSDRNLPVYGRYAGRRVDPLNDPDQAAEPEVAAFIIVDYLLQGRLTASAGTLTDSQGVIQRDQQGRIIILTPVSINDIRFKWDGKNENFEKAARQLVNDYSPEDMDEVLAHCQSYLKVFQSFKP